MAVARFTQYLKRFPFVTNMIVTGAVYGMGDASQQIIFRPSEPLDWRGSVRVAVVGSFVLAPMYVPWYKFLDGILPGTAIKTLVVKCICDQTLLSPVAISAFFIGNSILEQKKDVFGSLKERGVKAYLTGCVFWPPVQFSNFLMIPSHYRTVYIACASFVWSNVLCFIKRKDVQKPESLV